MVVLRASSNEVLPEDLYEATLVRVEKANGVNGIYLKWSFEVRGKLIPGFSGISAAPGAKVRKWAEVIEGREITDGETIDLDKLYGVSCRVYVSIMNGHTSQFNRIERVLLPRKPDEISGDHFMIVREQGIPMNGRWYTTPALSVWVDKGVIVRGDPQFRGEIYVYSPENWYIGTARCAPEGEIPCGPEAAPSAGGC